MSRGPTVWAVLALIGVMSCAAPLRDAETGPVPDSAPEATALAQRIEAIDQAVTVWRSAESIEAAHEAAEAAANLIVGPNGPGYGDRDGDGVVEGDTAAGVLPGLDGTPPGLAISLSDNDCVVRDVLGGSWTDPGAEWSGMLTAIEDWRPDNNTMPILASHPMRIVGWATFTLATDLLDEAHQYAGHAELHVGISMEALDC